MAIFKNVMLVVIFGAVSSVPQNGIANNNSQRQDLELSEAQYNYKVPSRGGRYEFGYGASSKVKNGYGVPSKSYGVAHKGYGLPKGIPLFRWDSPHPHYKIKSAVHHVKHGYPAKMKHHHGKNVVHVIKVNHHHVKPALHVKPAVSIPTVSSAGYGSASSSPVSNHQQPSITHSSGYSVTINNKGQASAYGLNKKPFTAFKPFNKGNGVAGSPLVIKDPVAPVIEVLPIAEVVAPVINVPAVEVVIPVVPEVVAPVVVVVPEVVPEELPLSAEVGAEPQSAEEEEEVEPVSAEMAPPPESPEAPPPVENVVVQPEADPLPVEEIAVEPVISEIVPVDPVEISEIEVEIVEIATDVAITDPVEEMEGVTETDQQQKDQVEDEKTDGGGSNKGSEEEEEEGNSEERS